MTTDVKTTCERVHVNNMIKACRLAWMSSPVSTAYCVGCVLVRPSNPSEIVETGYSRELPGNTHAEECAIRKLLARERESDRARSEERLDMYATMEPCSARLSGNQPCVKTIIDSKRVGRVFVGVLEPATLIKRCEGIDLLMKSGIDVILVRPKSKIPKDTRLRDMCLRPNRHVVGSNPFRVRCLHSRRSLGVKERATVDDGESAARDGRDDGKKVAVQVHDAVVDDAHGKTYRSVVLVAEPVLSAAWKTKASSVAVASLAQVGTIQVVLVDGSVVEKHTKCVVSKNLSDAVARDVEGLLRDAIAPAALSSFDL